MQAFDPKDLRRAFSTFATGVTIVTTQSAAGEPAGFTANSFASVSLEPPLVSVCPANGMRSFPAFAAATTFAINILAEDQQELAGRFASRGADKFAGTRWQPGHNGSPLLDGVVAWFECRTRERIPAGDHTILLGEILAYSYTDRTPLGFCGGAYVRFGLQQDVLDAGRSDHRLLIGAVLEADGSVLLEEHPVTRQLAVPTAPRLGNVLQPGSLVRKLADAGYDITLPFLFAVYEDGAVQFVVHRGHAARTATASDQSLIRAFPLDQIPWDRIARPAEKAMLERYQRERATNVTGIYVGTAESGELHTVAATRHL